MSLSDKPCQSAVAGQPCGNKAAEGQLLCRKHILARLKKDGAKFAGEIIPPVRFAGVEMGTIDER